MGGDLALRACRTNGLTLTSLLGWGDVLSVEFTTKARVRDRRIMDTQEGDVVQAEDSAPELERLRYYADLERVLQALTKDVKKKEEALIQVRVSHNPSEMPLMFRGY